MLRAFFQSAFPPYGSTHSNRPRILCVRRLGQFWIRLANGREISFEHFSKTHQILTMNLAATSFKFFCFAFALVSLSSPQASAKAFSPTHCKSHHSSQIPRVGKSWNYIQAKPSWIAMANESGENDITRRLSVRGGGQDEPSKFGKKLIREMVAE